MNKNTKNYTVEIVETIEIVENETPQDDLLQDIQILLLKLLQTQKNEHNV